MIILYSIVLGRCCLITCLSRSVDYFINMEQWKDIEWYEWKYQVSNYWNIKSLWNKTISRWRVSTKKDKLLKLHTDSNWRNQINLYENWVSKVKSVHRLVAQHFIENPYNYPIVMHLDNNPVNNNINNLKWGMWYHNSQQMAEEWRSNNWFKWRYWKDHHSSKQVNQYSLDWEFICSFWSWLEAQRKTWISSAFISLCCNGKKDSYGWFIWKF